MRVWLRGGMVREGGEDEGGGLDDEGEEREGKGKGW